MYRLLKIVEYALGTMRRHPLQSLALGVVYTIVVAILATLQIFSQSLKSEARNLLEHAPELVIQQMMAGRHDLVDEAATETIARIPGISRVEPRYWGYYYDPLTEANYTLIGREPGGDDGEGLRLLNGRLPEEPYQCALGAGVAKVRNIQQSDDMVLVDSNNIGRAFEVTGIFEADADLLTNDLIVLSNDGVRRFFGMPDGFATDLTVRVRNPREIDTIAGKIKSRLPRLRPISRQEILRTYDAVFDWRSGMLLMFFISSLLAFCILIWNKASGISAEERREIGILKAIGWDTGDILLLKFCEGLLLSAASFVTGLLLAFGHIVLAGSALLLKPLRGWSVLFPAFQPSVTLDFYSLATLAFLVVVPYLAATILPSWKAAVTDPDLVMRH